MSRGLPLCLLFLPIALGYFTKDFADYLQNTYGKDTLKQLERRDLFSSGSFGGEHGQRQVANNTPIVFIHGVTLRASVFTGHRIYFLARGYTDKQLFATTYGDGGKTAMGNVRIECEYVKTVRKMIEAVSNYTEQNVDMIVYSMGAAVSRKAILGGRCVDTNEDLGKPLTDKINNYIAVGGVVRGLEACILPAFARLGMCNKLNSMLCSSEYIQDVNTPDHRYEGARTFSLRSTNDGVVGQECCGHNCSQLPHATEDVVKDVLGHGTILTTTLDTQYDLLHGK